MPLRIQLPTKLGALPSHFHPDLRTILQYILLGVGAITLVVAFIVGFNYNKYARLTDEKLLTGPFPNSSSLYAAPSVLSLGDAGSPAQMAAYLRQDGYTENARNQETGWYRLQPDTIEIFPGHQSFSGTEPGALKFENGKLSSIVSLRDNEARTQYMLEPRLLSSLYDKNREKRRLVKYTDLPPVLVQAVVAIEDKRFFQHSGFDPVRIAKAVFVDLKERRNAQGASTITQQLARNLWLDRRKTFTRKFDELLITLHLEQKLTKEKIFEYYANQVDLGHRGTFAIRGFGEAAQAYFGKNVRSLTLPEAATLAGIIQAPGVRNPVSYPKRAEERRNVVLKQMLDNGYISESEYRTAVATSLITSRPGAESADAPYFVDLVNEQLANNFQDRDFQGSGSRIYSTLDLDLQRDAAEAVALGMREINTVLAKRSKKKDEMVSEPQVALICLDPHTGEVKALIGGRNYGVSQLDHVVAKRPSGSVFKPFVYAAALNTGLGTKPDRITPSTLVEDEAHTFHFAGEDYEPTDYHQSNWLGDVTIRKAFAKSLNVPTVEVAEYVGYSTVAALARKAGLQDVHGTPAMALGAYDVTPLEMTGAYTLFANNGVTVKPRFISEIVDHAGSVAWSAHTETKKILDPRVNFLMVSLMQEVLRSGTGAGVRARGFALPAAGKTGTSHDAWFAGFTSKLLCVVWVGMDNYQDLKMDGGKAAMPIWAEFMKRAHKHRAYHDVKDFSVPDGIVTAQIDSDTGQLATSTCPQASIRTEYYLVGTQPTASCSLHTAGATEVAGWDANSPNQSANLPNLPGAPPVLGASANRQDGGSPTQFSSRPKEKKGLFDKLKGIFK